MILRLFGLLSHEYKLQRELLVIARVLLVFAHLVDGGLGHLKRVHLLLGLHTYMIQAKHVSYEHHCGMIQSERVSLGVP